VSTIIPERGRKERQLAITWLRKKINAIRKVCITEGNLSQENWGRGRGAYRLGRKRGKFSKGRRAILG